METTDHAEIERECHVILRDSWESRIWLRPRLLKRQSLIPASGLLLAPRWSASRIPEKALRVLAQSGTSHRVQAIHLVYGILFFRGTCFRGQRRVVRARKPHYLFLPSRSCSGQVAGKFKWFLKFP